MLGDVLRVGTNRAGAVAGVIEGGEEVVGLAGETMGGRLGASEAVTCTRIAGGGCCVEESGIRAD